MWNVVLNNPLLLLVNWTHHTKNIFDTVECSLLCDVRCRTPNWVYVVDSFWKKGFRYWKIFFHIVFTGSMLHTMFSGRFDTKPGEDGSYFIDRDGTHFRHILNYLRTGKLVLPDDKVVRKELLSEAEFYRIDGILNELKAKPFKCSFVSAMLIEYRPLLTLCQKSLVIFFYILGA